MGQLDLAYCLHRQHLLVFLHGVQSNDLEGLPETVNFRCRLLREVGHYCMPIHNLLDEFENHFGYRINSADFNRHQRIIIIPHSSSPDTMAVSAYWKSKGLDIEEYFYRFYNADCKTFFELSNELFFNQNAGHCWINTCSRHIPDAVFDMVRNRKAATYEERKGVIGGWMKRGHMFLYQNGCGIVASGTGTATIKDEYNESLGVN
jgi:hypothetical protein